MTLRTRPARRGMTLIEVLLALAILLLSLAALGQLVDVGLRRGNAARATTRGTHLAESKMAEVEAGVVPLTGGASGTFEGDDAAWTYTVTPEAAGPPNLYAVTVTVTRTLDGKPFDIVLTQMIFDPTLTGSAAQAERPPEQDPAEDTSTTGGTSP
ncbi:MAG TPA: prepilin-type N-terminal cleavage/methylation domain-containing protein [Gemmata sp.]